MLLHRDRAGHERVWRAVIGKDAWSIEGLGKRLAWREQRRIPCSPVTSRGVPGAVGLESKVADGHQRRSVDDRASGVAAQGRIVGSGRRMLGKAGQANQRAEACY